MRIRTALSGRRGSFLGFGLVLLTCLVVVLAHSEPNAHDMDGSAGGMADAVTICMAVLQVGGGLALLGGLVRLARRRFSFRPAASLALSLRFTQLTNDLGHRIRPGPVTLQVFLH